ncbi:unnamed protein product, partial [Hydatigera taeniaeformis]|uniref:BPTI/Kunitz inhibitor domain-containing protein n=1 Tax=Hydatigena taeniaeformis TaxID=6205 RepID=A0A0R3X361_HYDTA
LLEALARSTLLSLDTVDPCKQPIEAGDCIGFFPRWGMNQETGQCEEFIFGGCGGNDNQFDTKEKCEAFCIRGEPNGETTDSSSLPICTLCHPQERFTTAVL